jgi:hypothetical protein
MLFINQGDNMRWMWRAITAAAMLAMGVVGAGAATAQELGGSTYPGPYYMGAPDAPVTIEEFADFQ